jgi:hypothetical protein
LGWRTTATLSYLGNKGTHLFRSINANSAYINPVTNAIVRNYSSVYGTNAINFRQSDGESIYNAMNLEIRHRFYQHLLFQGNWAWAKGTDNVGQNVQSALLDVQNLGRDRANSDYVRRHSLNLTACMNCRWDASSLCWRTCRGGWIRRQAAGAWGHLAFRHRPLPYAGLYQRGRTQQHQARRRVWRAGESSRGSADTAVVVQSGWLRVCPRRGPGDGTAALWKCRPQYIAGPGTNYMDANLSKEIPLGRERQTLTLRVEAFNLLNHPNYANPT